MKIIKEFRFSDNGCEINEYNSDSDIEDLSEKAVEYGIKVGAIVTETQTETESKPQNKSKKAPSNKAK